MKQKLAIIGANEAITILINKAKKLGYETHVFAWKNGDPGEIEADFFYPISIDEKDQILKQCRKIGISGVCSITSDFAAPTVNYVARGLGLTSNPERTDIVARNKYKMRSALKDAGLYMPPFIEVDNSFSINDFSMKFPVIVKPTDRWSSKGVTCVRILEDLKPALQFAIAESFDGKAIIEGYMDGPEYSAECICFHKERRILAITQKQTTGFPHYIETGHIQPAKLMEAQETNIHKVILRALEALEINNGAAHAEFRILKNGEIGIVEIGARMGGGTIGTDLTPISTGMDYVKMVIDVACGNEPDFSVVTQPIPVAVKFIMGIDDLYKYQEIQAKEPEKIIRVSKFDEDCSTPVIDDNTRHGYYIMKL